MKLQPPSLGKNPLLSARDKRRASLTPGGDQLAEPLRLSPRVDGGSSRLQGSISMCANAAGETEEEEEEGGVGVGGGGGGTDGGDAASSAAPCANCAAPVS